MDKITNQNTLWHKPSVFQKDREAMNGHKSVVIWFTGLSGAGKSTLAHAVEDSLHKNRMRTFVLDGDNIRHGLCKDLGFSDNDRIENIRRIGELSLLMMEAGVIVLTAFISPFTKDRRIVRKLIADGKFIEVYCSAPLEVCEARDVKGLYQQAHAGEIPNFTGVSSVYQTPENPEIILKTDELSITESVAKVVHYLKDKQITKLD